MIWAEVRPRGVHRRQPLLLCYKYWMGGAIARRYLRYWSSEAYFFIVIKTAGRDSANPKQLVGWGEGDMPAKTSTRSCVTVL